MNGFLTMRQFGHWGRAGNQFFQYSFLTSYAHKYSLELQLPKWVGNHLFGTNNPPMTCKNLPVWTNQRERNRQEIPPVGDELANHDFRGFAQYHTSYFAPGKERIVNLFQPVKEVLARIAPVQDRLRNNGNAIIGIHLRRGDYGWRNFPIIPTSWYLKWLKTNISRFDNPTVFIATEDYSLVKDFAKYNPVTTESLGLELNSEPLADCVYLQRDLATGDRRALDWYPDFYLLSQCNVVLGPSSTFSFFAAMLNNSLVEFWRASLATEKFEQIDVWNDIPLLHENVKDYPHLEGIRLRSNPYW